MRWPIALCLLLLTACTQYGTIRETMPEGFQAWQATPPEYRFGPGDEIEIKMIYHPELSDRLLVAPDGRVSLPLVGSVRVEGKTSDELAAELKALYRRELREPDVTVIGRAFASQRVLVGGEVMAPGVYTITGRLGAMQAAMLAGGFRETARLDQVALIRRGPDDKPMLRIVNVEAVLNGSGSGNDVPLMPHDIVFVPRSTVAEIDLWVEQYINRTLPFGRSFNYSINRNTNPATQ
ncbi:polysaccharide biosynthesis/export family protein [Azospirillum sp.]|uniref:polysaccharide biosynthesis/export family protein n=1 Tax=Azospirillum sp. TaxID=34012 RepID=UPI002D51474B|nr:polysaccharide biosynthesis/export family protein [Azospirillum sp.]HYD65704.1 polysaccharide biosynthesis/export family protein [Azospirillum sp.]